MASSHKDRITSRSFFYPRLAVRGTDGRPTHWNERFEAQEGWTFGLVHVAGLDGADARARVRRSRPVGFGCGLYDSVQPSPIVSVWLLQHSARASRCAAVRGQWAALSGRAAGLLLRAGSCWRCVWSGGGRSLACRHEDRCTRHDPDAQWIEAGYSGRAATSTTARLIPSAIPWRTIDARAWRCAMHDDRQQPDTDAAYGGSNDPELVS